jgi:hypothetical protein
VKPIAYTVIGLLVVIAVALVRLKLTAEPHTY